MRKFAEFTKLISPVHFFDHRLQPGSLGAVREFFGAESFPTRLLRQACERLELTVDLPSAEAKPLSTFLGKGGSGTVYSLRNKHDVRVAVKLCHGTEESAHLTNEVSSFKAAMLRFGLDSCLSCHVAPLFSFCRFSSFHLFIHDFFADLPERAASCPS